MSGKTWIVTEFYYPDENATGSLMTNLAKGLRQQSSVGVVCRMAKPAEIGQETHGSSHESIDVHRVWSTHFSKDVLGLRVINILTLSCSIFLSLLLNLRREDAVLVVTNPPSLPYVTLFSALLKRAACIVLVYDVYPEVLVATGLMRKDHPFVTILHWLTSRLFHAANVVVVLGRDMQRLIVEGYRGSQRNLRIIPNWVDTEEIKPMVRSTNAILHEQRLQNKFVVGYLGNIGRTHDIEKVMIAAQSLAHDVEIHFLFIGNGAKKQFLDDYVANNKLMNVTVLPFFDRTRQSEVHNACDLSIISFISGMAGLSVPSRMYNMMAAGKPILAVAEQKSELAMVIEEENIGWVVSSNDPSDIARIILNAKQHPEICLQMGRRARAVAVEKYSFDRILPRYRELLAAVSKERA